MCEDLGAKIINNINLSFKKVHEHEIIVIEIKPLFGLIFHLGEDFIVRDGPVSQKLEGKEMGDYIFNHFNLNLYFSKKVNFKKTCFSF